MEEFDYLIILYDYYGELLSKGQQEYFEAYYFDNLSLSEIADNMNKSRNAVHKSIKAINLKLYEYEEKLKMYSKNEQIKEIINGCLDKEIKNKIIEIIEK